MAFVNTAINVSQKIGNNTVNIELVYHKSIKASVTVPPLERHDLKAKKTYTIVIPDGHYSVTTLETAIAKQVYTIDRQMACVTAVVYLASARAAHVSGTVLPVDKGALLAAVLL